MAPDSLGHITARLYEQRWGCVAEFVSQVLPVWEFLCSTWDAAKYLHAVDSHRGDREAEKKFDAHMFTEALHSPGFHLKLLMMNMVEQCLQSLSRWAEGCPCHSTFLQSLSRKQVERWMSDSIGPGYGSAPHKSICPFAGKRGPELAAGHLQQFFQTLSQQGETQLLSDPRALQATAAEQAEVSTMFRHCTSRIHLFLKIKLTHWQQLPHVWCGVAHWDKAVAQQCARKGRELFQQNPEAPWHHSLTLTMCCRLRDDLDKFIAGSDMLCLSQAFQEVVAQLLFIPVSERTIEQKHALVTMALHKSGLKGSTVRLSFANRIPELHSYLNKHYDEMPKLLDCFAQARHHRRVPALLGLDAHPLIAALPPSTRSSHYTKILRAILYRADVESQTWSLIREHSLHAELLEASKLQVPQVSTADHGM